MFDNIGTSDLTKHALAGRAYASGSTALAVPNGERFRFLHSNPAGSGVYVSVANIVFQSRTNKFFTLQINPTVKPTAALAIGNRLVGAGPAGKAQCFADVSATAMSGGVLLPYSLAATNNGRNSEDLDPPFILAPGYSIGIELHNDSGAPTDVSFVSTWVEINVP